MEDSIEYNDSYDCTCVDFATGSYSMAENYDCTCNNGYASATVTYTIGQISETYSVCAPNNCG
jgi:hypothetical protein